MAKKNARNSLLLPWDRRAGVLGAVSRTRLRFFLLGAGVLGFALWVRQREEHAASVRATRASITVAGKGLLAYRAAHAGGCPKNLETVVSEGFLRDVPVDAWGRALRVSCPGRKDRLGFDVSSDGPDGVAGGLDRVE
ncbi:hypothetical protein BH09MYX1_BH09MYX1_22800 [soil metagenome]